jgi:hypothetical protein
MRRVIARATAMADVLVLSGGAFALANRPDRAQTIHGCYRATGALRVVDTELG